MKNETSTTVSFRLLSGDFKLLAEASVAGESPGECARRLLLAALNDAYQVSLMESLVDLKAELETLHARIAKLAVALLVDAGKCQIADAEQFVTEMFQED